MPFSCGPRGSKNIPCCCAAAAGIELAAKDGVDWILHIDTDELVYPGGGPEYSIQRVLTGVPADVDTIVFPNYESLPERDDVQDPFTEVSAAVHGAEGLCNLLLAGTHHLGNTLLGGVAIQCVFRRSPAMPMMLRETCHQRERIDYLLSLLASL